ncbi:UNVERIFIED_CONTAM: Myb-like DNA-binding domain protein [Siphonaria sp. JEL0065]|nr:Myb-like DNA-binding domain protein [Siphonaria sp. JEL0065]
MDAVPSQAKLQEEVERENKLILSRNGQDPLPPENDPRLRSNTTGINWSSIARALPPSHNKSATDCRIHYLVNQHPNVNRSLFTRQEVDLLEEVGGKVGWEDWDLIAREVGNGRVAWQCFRVYQKYINPTSQSWTPDEDSLLCTLISKHGSKDWVQISRHMGTRTRTQCITRWRQTLKPGITKGKWTVEEDVKLREAVEVHGIGNWTKISQDVETRNDVQCRERYLNALNPELKKGAFSEEENTRLLDLVGQYGQKWTKVAKAFKSRTAKMCKAQYNKLTTALALASASASAVNNNEEEE